MKDTLLTAALWALALVMLYMGGWGILAALTRASY